MKRIIRYTSVYLKNAAVRLNVAVLFGLILNACYIIYNFVCGIIYGDAWFITVGAYYFLILSVRFLLLRDKESDEASETAGFLMLVLGVPITGMIIYNVITNSSREHGAAAIPIFFVYTVYSVLRAAFGIIKSKRKRNLTHRAVHSLRLSAALMSLFNFQTSLLATLKLADTLELSLNFVMGAVVSLSVFAMARRTGLGLNEGEKQ